MNKLRDTNQADIHPDQLRQFQSIIKNLLRCCQERLQFQSSKFNLPDAELRCIILFEGERYLTPKGISLKMNVVKSRVTKIIDGLEKRHMVKRVKDPGDSRGILLCLTSLGQKKLAEVMDFNNCIYKDVLITMEPDTRKIMLTNLEMLMTSMETAKDLMMRDP